MFTGIIQEVGEVAAVAEEPNGARITVRMPGLAPEIGMGDSVAVNGTCLTAVELGPELIAFEAMGETLDKTSLRGVAPGDRVNLERAVTVDKRLGGHIVQGHVDGVGEVRGTRPDGIAKVVEITAPPEVLRYVVEKGSIAVDGVSLTVSAETDGGFEIWLIPHTCEATTFDALAPGDRVNLEADVLAKYVERLANGRGDAASG